MSGNDLTSQQAIEFLSQNTDFKDETLEYVLGIIFMTKRGHFETDKYEIYWCDDGLYNIEIEKIGEKNEN